MIVEYSNFKKSLGLEFQEFVKTPRKIARKIKMLADEIREEKKKKT